MNTILVTLDGTALAEQALPYAQLLAPLLGAELRLLRVVSEGEVEGWLADEDARLVGGAALHALPARERDAWGGLRREAERYLDEQVARLSAGGLRVERELRTGAPAAQIVAAAARPGCALIAMATHGYSGLLRWTLGSVASAVLGATSTPLLLTRAAGAAARPPALRRIMVPLDGSDLAAQALPMAAALAAGSRAELVLFQALAPSIEEYLHTPLAHTDVRAALREQARDVLAADAAPAVTIVPAVAIGAAADAIVEEAALRQIDLIVMTTYSAGAGHHPALGSVVDRLIHRATTPLLLVHPATSPHG